MYTSGDPVEPLAVVYRQGSGHTHECPVCLDDMLEGEVVAAYACMHRVHATCARTWADTEGASWCPICDVVLGHAVP